MLILTAFALALVGSAPQRYGSAWSDRGIESVFSSWATAVLAVVAGLGAAVAASLAWHLPASSPILTGIVAAAGLAAIAACTDIGSQRIPKDVCWEATTIGMCALLLASPGPLLWFNLVGSFAMTCLAPFALALATRGGIGTGDLRLTLAFTATLGWWAGYTALGIGLIFACALQLLFRLARRYRSDRVTAFGPAIIAGTLGGIALFAGA